MNKMIVANLVHRPIRSIISIFAVAVEVTLILMIVGLALGILEDNKTRQVGMGADLTVRPPGSSNLAAFGGAPVPIRVADILRKQPHVVAVSPVVLQVFRPLTLRSSMESIWNRFRLWAVPFDICKAAHLPVPT